MKYLIIGFLILNGYFAIVAYEDKDVFKLILYTSGVVIWGVAALALKLEEILDKLNKD